MTIFNVYPRVLQPTTVRVVRGVIRDCHSGIILAIRVAGAAVGYARGMRVRVLCFGVLGERVGGNPESLEIGEGAIVADVLNVYRERLPEFGWDSIAVAVNQEYARGSDVLKDGDEVALLPPVSGGLGAVDGCRDAR